MRYHDSTRLQIQVAHGLLEAAGGVGGLLRPIEPGAAPRAGVAAGAKGAADGFHPGPAPAADGG